MPVKSTTPAANLKRFRAEQGLSQRALGRVIGRGLSQIGEMETGHADVPTWLSLIIAICRQQDIRVKDVVV